MFVVMQVTGYKDVADPLKCSEKTLDNNGVDSTEE